MKKKLIVAALIIAAISAILVYNYVFNSEHRNISNEKATVTLSADQFYSDFKNDESSATIKYLDKVIETKGQITLIENKDVILNDKVQVSLDVNDSVKLQKGEQLTIKGRCVGYDELLEMIKIDQATIITN